MATSAGQISTELTLNDQNFNAGLRQAVQNSEQSARRIENAFGGVGDGLAQAGNSLTLFSVAVGGAFAVAASQLANFGQEALRVGGAFEAAMTSVAAISGADAKQLSALTDKARELGATLPIMAQDAAAAMGVLASRGYDAEKMLADLGDIVNLSIAQGYGLAESADLVSAALTNFQMDISQVGHVANVFTEACNRSALSMSKLQYSFVYAAAPAAAMGMKIEELVAHMGALGDSGMQGEMIGTTLRNIMSKVASSTKIMGVATRLVSGATPLAGLHDETFIRVFATQFVQISDDAQLDFSKVWASSSFLMASGRRRKGGTP
jgi:hypothetical protein